MVFSFVEFLRVCFSTQNWTRILTSLDTESYDWLKKRLDSYWKISISNSWHWKGFIEKLQFFSFLLIIILLHFRKVPILLTQLDCHIHFSVSLLDFFVYLIRLCQCCTSAERFNKKNFFLLIGTAFTSSVRISISNFMLLENLWLWKCPGLFSACVSWHSELAIVCQYSWQNDHFWEVSTGQLTIIFSSRLQLRKASRLWRFLQFEIHHVCSPCLNLDISKKVKFYRWRSWIIQGTSLQKWNNFLQNAWTSSASTVEKNAVWENWFFMP